MVDFCEDALYWIAEKVFPVLFFLLLVGLAIAAVCGLIYWGVSSHQDDGVTAGVVVHKDFYPAHTNMVLVGKIMMPQYIPDRYAVTVQGLTKKTRHIEQDEFSLPQQDWETVTIGQEMKLP